MPEKTRVEITETSEPPAKAGFQADLQDRKLIRVYLERIEVKFNGDSPKDKSPDKDNREQTRVKSTPREGTMGMGIDDTRDKARDDAHRQKGLGPSSLDHHGDAQALLHLGSVPSIAG